MDAGRDTPGGETDAASEAVAVAEAAPAAAEPVVAPVVPASPAEPAPPPTPGARLRDERERRRLDVEQVTDALHIEARLIAAMEADEYGAFDAPVYARGFLRKYATFLELPADEILAGYERLHLGPGAPTLLPPATAAAPPRDWSAYKVPAAAAALLVLVGGSYWWWLTHAPAPPAREAAPAAAPAAARAAPAVPPPDAAATGTATPEAAPAPTPAAATAPPVVAATAAPPASGAALEIEFQGDCWAEVTGPGGRRLMYDLGHAGESRTLPGPGPWRVFLGAADGARLRVSGRPVPVPPAKRNGRTAKLVVGPDGTVQ
jgi:cytoskeleton protein RodZ